MMWSDGDIELALRGGDIRVTPEPERDAIQPASLDLQLGSDYARLESPYPNAVIDPSDGTLPKVEQFKQKEFVLFPGKFVLATTIERVELGPNVAARIEGKSSWGRLGLVVHSTAGFIDPGFCGQITLEMYNLGPSPIRLREGMYVCQLAFHPLVHPAVRPYGDPLRRSKYMGQSGAQESKWGFSTQR